MKIFEKFNAKTALNAASIAVGVIALVVNNKKDAADKAAFKSEAAEEAAKIVMAKMSTEKN